ncbi:hypothetical protein ACO2Q3_09265 [Caulobacter sp. KR2-114]|uniref:hypothetical protein n=1 Tax=Caulobacter sp. KR2-114 TaxID=3400912 RepID=UPI003C11F91D
MAEIQVGESATAGLRLIARRPFSVLTWGVLASAYVTVILVLFGGGVAVAVMSMVKAGADPRPEQVFGLIGSALGAIGLLIIGLIFIGAMIQGAVFRTELEPERSAFAFLRLGRQELWLIAVNFVLSFLLWVVQAVLSIPLVIVTVGMGMAGGAGLSAAQHDPGAFAGAMAGALGLRLIGQLIITVVTIWLWLRFSMGAVMSFREREFRLFESWNLTKGHAGQIFMTMLLVWLMMMLIYFIAWMVVGVTAGVTVFANSDLSNAQTLASLTAAGWISRLTPMIAVFAVVLVALIGIGNAMTWGAVAHIYRQLRPPAEVAATFS